MRFSLMLPALLAIQACVPQYARLEARGDAWVANESFDSSCDTCAEDRWRYAVRNYTEAVERWPARRGEVDPALLAKLEAARRTYAPFQARRTSAKFEPLAEAMLRTDDLTDPYTAFDRLYRYVLDRGNYMTKEFLPRPDALDARFLARLDGVQAVWEEMARRPHLPGLTLAGLGACKTLLVKAAKYPMPDDPLVRDIQRRCDSVRAVTVATIRDGIDDPGRGPMAKAARWKLLGLLESTDAYQDEQRAALEVARSHYSPHLDITLSGIDACPDGASRLAEALGDTGPRSGVAVQAGLTLTKCGLTYSFEQKDVEHSKTTVEDEPVTEYVVVGSTSELVCSPAFESYSYGPPGSLTATVTTHNSCSTVQVPIYETRITVRPVERVHTWTTTSDVYDYRYRLVGTLTVGGVSTPFEASAGHLFELPPGEKPVIDAAALLTGSVERAVQQLQASVASGQWMATAEAVRASSRTDPAALEEYYSLLEMQDIRLTGTDPTASLIGFHKEWLLWMPPGDISRESADTLISLVDPSTRAQLGLIEDFRPQVLPAAK